MARNAIAIGLTGPALAASGVDFDLRRDMPSAVRNFKFQVAQLQRRHVWSVTAAGLKATALAGEGGHRRSRHAFRLPQADHPRSSLPDRESVRRRWKARIYQLYDCSGSLCLPRVRYRLS